MIKRDKFWTKKKVGAVLLVSGLALANAMWDINPQKVKAANRGKNSSNVNVALSAEQQEALRDMGKITGTESLVNDALRPSGLSGHRLDNWVFTGVKRDAAAVYYWTDRETATKITYFYKKEKVREEIYKHINKYGNKNLKYKSELTSVDQIKKDPKLYEGQIEVEVAKTAYDATTIDLNKSIKDGFDRTFYDELLVDYTLAAGRATCMTSEQAKNADETLRQVSLMRVPERAIELIEDLIP